MILFLDFDGVLHPEIESGGYQNFEKAHLLWQILREFPRLEVVFTTSWRRHRTVQQLAELATRGGGEDVLPHFIDATPDIEPSAKQGDYKQRRIEIEHWLYENERQHELWLALDDVPYWFGFPCSNLYVVEHCTGLTDADVITIINKLREMGAT